jgi:hypothetical protein
MHCSAADLNELMRVVQTMATIVATTEAIVREAEVRMIQIDICDEYLSSYIPSGRAEGFTDAGCQSIRAFQTAHERHLAAPWVHHSIIQSLLRNVRIVSTFL